MSGSGATALPSAWVLNLDAEDELARPSHTTRKDVEARIPALSRALGGLILPHDRVLVAGDVLPPGERVGRAWCPTPRALARLAGAGALVPAAPPFAVLRAVNHRHFSADLGQTLPGARYVRALEDALALLASESPMGQWLCKRPFGYAGRGRRKIAAGTPDPSDQAWLAASLRDGEGLQIEPWVTRTLDVALHGYVSRAGAVFLGQPTRQESSAQGAWLATLPLPDAALEPHELTALHASAMSAAGALARAGYFGPFGVDAYRWTSPEGASLFNPRSEINARYAMGWAIGMGTLRPDLEESAP